MQEPAIPPNEAERLRALRGYDVLDTGPEAAFDALTSIAAYVMGVPITLVSLIDVDRQWFKSRYGLDAPQTPRDVSFCGHVVATEAPLVVPDALGDERFRDNPLVTGAPRVRFYAGFPLRTPDGFVLGSLCAIDHEAREMTPAQRDVLQKLAQQVVDQLELRRTNRKLVEKHAELEAALTRMTETASRLQSIFDSASYSIIETNPDGIIRSFNPAAEKLLGYSADEVVGKMSPTAFHPPTEMRERAAALSTELGVAVAPGFDSFTTKAQRGGIVEIESTYVRRDGAHVPVQLSISARRTKTGELLGYTGIAYDISDRKRIDRLQSEFISTVSHELRTPLTSIRGALGLVAGGVLGEIPKDAQEYVRIALSNGDRLVRLINDMLDIEKMQSGRMEFRMKTVDLRAAVARAIAANEGFAAQNKVTMRIVGDPAPGEVLADEDRLAQVITNLLSNAAKFSPQGGEVELSVAHRGGFLRVGIRDHGPGIPAEFRARIFERFAQADSSTRRHTGGTGLGLNISRAIVERMRGRIGFESPEGGGTTFYFELPFVAPVTDYEEQVAGDRALVCEDDPDVAKLITRTLEAAGYVVHASPTLERARRLLARHTYRLMTLDLMLADGDGAALIPELRSSETNRALQVVLISGTAGRLDASALSVADVIRKPFDEGRLIAALGLARAKGDRAPSLLHVEDDPDVRAVVARMLPESWRVAVADSVASARERLRAEAFDVVLLDLSLPDGSGEDLLTDVGDAAVVLFTAQEVSSDLSARVSVALTKTRATESELRDKLVGLFKKYGSGPP